MSGSISNAKLISSLVHGISIAINRRGYAAASQGVVTSVVRGGSRSEILKQGEERSVNKEGTENSWIPDPVTGFYCPANRTGDIDVADLREMLLNNKINQH